jgi:ethanolamine utilization microcompartment shell protein EutS
MLDDTIVPVIMNTINTITSEHTCVIRFMATVFAGTIDIGNLMRFNTSAKLIIDISAPSIA